MKRQDTLSGSLSLTRSGITETHSVSHHGVWEERRFEKFQPQKQLDCRLPMTEQLGDTFPTPNPSSFVNHYRR